jgi:thioredoxin 1
MEKKLNVEEVDIFRLEELIEQQDIVIVDFWATWCAPCLGFADVFAKVAQTEPKLKFVKMNIGEASQDVLDSLGILSVPHLMIFKKGVAVYSEAGTIPQAVLKDLVEQTKQLVVEKD